MVQMNVVPIHLSLVWDGESQVETDRLYPTSGPFVVQVCVLEGHKDLSGGFWHRNASPRRVQGWRLPDFFLISLSDELQVIAYVELSNTFERGTSHRAFLELDRAGGPRKLCPVCHKSPLCYTVALVDSQRRIRRTLEIRRNSPTFVSIRVLPDARLREVALPLTEILSACVQSARFEVDMNREAGYVKFPRELWNPTNHTDAVLQARRDLPWRIMRESVSRMTGIKILRFNDAKRGHRPSRYPY